MQPGHLLATRATNVYNEGERFPATSPARPIDTTTNVETNLVCDDPYQATRSELAELRTRVADLEARAEKDSELLRAC